MSNIEILDDMCRVCTYGQGQPCRNKIVTAGLSNDEDKLKEMRRRAQAGYCDDAMWDEPISLTTERNKKGLQRGPGDSWLWKWKLPPRYIDLGNRGEREDGRGNRPVHIVKQVKVK